MNPNPNHVELTPTLDLTEFEGLDNEEIFGDSLTYLLKSNNKLLLTFLILLRVSTESTSLKQYFTDVSFYQE